MAKPEGERVIKFRIQDTFAAAYFGVPMGPSTVSEEQIRAFCGGCDELRSDNTCPKVGDDQARYAARLQCGWASVGGSEVK